MSSSESTTAPGCHGVSRHGLTNQTDSHMCLMSEDHLCLDCYYLNSNAIEHNIKVSEVNITPAGTNGHAYQPNLYIRDVP